MRVRLDLNNQVFQSHWFNLEKEDRNAVLPSCINASDCLAARPLRNAPSVKRTLFNRDVFAHDQPVWRQFE